MPSYEVEIREVTTKVTTILVEADNADDAYEIATEKTGDPDWASMAVSSTEYEVGDIINEVEDEE
jgi:hypothetical protein